MKKPLSFLVVLLLAFGITGQASALTITGADIIYEGSVTYADDGVFSGQGTIIEKEFINFDLIENTVTYGSSNLDEILDGQGRFRWSERIMNSTLQVWTDFHVEISGDNGVFFSDGTSPFVAEIYIGDGATVTKVSNGTVDFSSSSIDFFLENPVTPGSSLEIQIPIHQLSVPAEGATSAFVLSQYPTAAPEPATMFLLGTGLIGMAMIGRWKFFKRQ